MFATSTKVPVPIFDSRKPYKAYKNDVAIWQIVCKLDKKEQALHLVYALPADDPSGIRQKQQTELDDLTKLNADDGVEVFMKWMDDYFKGDEQIEAYEAYIAFDSYRRASNQKISDFLMEFDRLYAAAAKHEMTLSDNIKALKLLDSARLSDQDRKFALTGIDFKSSTDVYKATQRSVRKFAGDNFLFGGGGGASTNSTSQPVSFKTEPVFSAEELSHPSRQLEEVLAGSGYYRRGDWRGGDRYQGELVQLAQGQVQAC